MRFIKDPCLHMSSQMNLNKLTLKRQNLEKMEKKIGPWFISFTYSIKTEFVAYKIHTSKKSLQQNHTDSSMTRIWKEEITCFIEQKNNRGTQIRHSNFS